MDFKLNTKITKGIWLSLRKFVLFVVPMILVLAVPIISQANPFTDVVGGVINLFSPLNASADSQSFIENSQNMPLLESATNIDPFTDNCSDLLVLDGEEALLPSLGPSTNSPCDVDNSGGSIINYIVRNGDTLASIADMFDVSVNTILWYNGLPKNSVLRVGQTLYILPISGIMYTVISGDTLNTIARKHNGDIDEIASYNNMKVTDKLLPGDKIMIPNGQASLTVSGGSSIAASGPAYNGYYRKPFIVGHRTQGSHGIYNAVDYGMPVGSPLSAAAAGTVIVSNFGYNGGYGNYVKIQHSNGTQTVYAHMSDLAVSVGQTVTQGQLIGYSGNTGKSTGPHLHFEIRGAKNPF